MTGETEDTAHLKPPKLSLKIISAELQRFWKISTGKQQGLLGQKFATMTKINMEEKLMKSEAVWMNCRKMNNRGQK